MSVAYRPSSNRSRSLKQPRTRKTLPKATKEARVIPLKTTPTVQRLPTPSEEPFWLRSLFILQQSSSVVAFCLIGSTLIIYGLTVYTQQIWSREYRKLESLEREERNLIATHETLKNQLAKDALKEKTGLVAPHPTHTIFLSPATEPAFKTAPPPPPEEKPAIHQPIAY